MDQEVERSGEVIIGKVLGSRDVMSKDAPDIVGKTVYRVKVITTFKGIRQSRVEITSDNTSSRFNMDVGKQYLLFVQSFGDENLVDSCGNSGELIDKGDIIKHLKRRNATKGK